MTQPFPQSAAPRGDPGYRELSAAGGAFDDFLRDESRKTGHADSFSFPQTESEVCSVLRGQCAHGVPITIQGARTGLAAGAVPFGGHVVNLSKMNRITGMRRGGDGAFHLLIQPGVVLSTLTKQLESGSFPTAGWDDESLRTLQQLRAGPPQFFPTDPTETSASLGGMAACNASGARSFRYGAMRRHIAGVRVALCGGDLIVLRRGQCRAVGRALRIPTQGGGVIACDLPAYRMPACKSAAGYYAEDDMDAVDLFIGSDGTLGILTELELRLSPAPACVWGATFFFRALPHALTFVRTARESGSPTLAALEYFDSGALHLLHTQRAENPAFTALPNPPQGFACAIYCELHCPGTAEAQRCLLALGELAVTAGGDEADSWVARTAFDRDRLTFFRHAAPECVNLLIDRRRQHHPGLTKLGTDMAVPDQHLEAVLDMYHSSLDTEGLDYAIWGHIGDNHVHVNLLPRDEREYTLGRDLYKRWARQVVAMGGTVSAEHSIGKLKADFLALLYSPAHIAQMAALRAKFDPAGLLSRGNLF